MNNTELVLFCIIWKSFKCILLCPLMQVPERNGKILHTRQIRLIIKYVRMICYLPFSDAFVLWVQRESTECFIFSAGMNVQWISKYVSWSALTKSINLRFLKHRQNTCNVLDVRLHQNIIQFLFFTTHVKDTYVISHITSLQLID